MIVKFDSDKTGAFKSLINNFKESKKFLDEVKKFQTQSEKISFMENFIPSDSNGAFVDYITAVDSAQWSLQGFIKYSLSAKNASSLLSKALVGVAGSAKKLLSVFINAAIWFVVEKAIEGIVSLIQNAVKSRILSLSYSYILFPLYSCRWFTCNIVDDTVNVVNFVNDSNRNLLENLPWKFRKVSCHTVN